MAIASAAIETVLANIEAVLNHINHANFLARAYAIAGSENEHAIDTLLSRLPSALKLALKEGTGFVALSYPHLGSLELG